MPNPLFNSLCGTMGGKTGIPSSAGLDALTGPSGAFQNGMQGGMQDVMQKLQSDPSGMLRQAGYNVPREIASDPHAAVMHLLRSGQVGGPMMKMIAPMLSQLGVR